MTERILHKGNWIEMVEDDGWEYYRRIRGATAVIIPAMVGNNYILVEQYRKPTKSRCLEWAAGLVGDIDESENPEEAGLRELIEETGYQAIDHFFLDIPQITSPGASSEKFYFLLCSNCKKVESGGGVDDEDIITHVVPSEQMIEFLEEKAYDGLSIDSKIYAGIQLLKVYCSI